MGEIMRPVFGAERWQWPIDPDSWDQEESIKDEWLTVYGREDDVPSASGTGLEHALSLMMECWGDEDDSMSLFRQVIDSPNRRVRVEAMYMIRSRVRNRFARMGSEDG